MIDLQSMYMKEIMRKRIKQIKDTYKAAQIACENTLYRYKYSIFYKGYRGLLRDEFGVKVELAQTFNKIKQRFKHILSKAAVWRTLRENSKK